MSCETTRQRLLRCERPDRPPAELQTHLAGCPACRALQRRLTRIEKRVTEVEVPASTPPPDLIRKILAGPPATPSTNGDAPPWWVAPPTPPVNGNAAAWWVTNPDSDRLVTPRLPRHFKSREERLSSRDRTRRKVALAFALTLGLVVLSLTLKLWPREKAAPQPAPRGDVAVTTKPSKLDQQLASARTPRERVKAIADFVEGSKNDAQRLARIADSAELPVLAKNYAQVMREKLPEIARNLPPIERDALLDELAKQLINSESELQRLASENPGSDNAVALREMANAAREGHDSLRAMMAKG